MGELLPSVEIADKVEGIGLGRPFPVCPALSLFVVIDPEILISFGKTHDTAEIALDFV